MSIQQSPQKPEPMRPDSIRIPADLRTYPTFVWRLTPGSGMGKTDELYAQLLANSVDRSKDGLRPLQEATKEHGEPPRV